MTRKGEPFAAPVALKGKRWSQLTSMQSYKAACPGAGAGGLFGILYTVLYLFCGFLQTGPYRVCANILATVMPIRRYYMLIFHKYVVISLPQHSLSNENKQYQSERRVAWEASEGRMLPNSGIPLGNKMQEDRRSHEVQLGSQVECVY